MIRAMVNVATGRYAKGQERLRRELSHYVGDERCVLQMYDSIRGGWPTQQEKPYAFKAYALQEAVQLGADSLLWCDASIWPVRSLEPTWEKIERDGYLFMNNGFSNYEWTADSAYPDLFAHGSVADWPHNSSEARSINRTIPHTVGAFFGLSMRHELGRAALAEYYRLASETQAFCGPWTNTLQTPCGPADVRGHRHDQSCLSVIAWRLGMVLTNCPRYLIYANSDGKSDPREQATDPRTLVIVNGQY